MRWTIPTLIYTLFANGASVEVATDIVAATYGLTGGDENFDMRRDRFLGDHAVGPYALWDSVRGDYPSDAPTHAGADARTIVAALRDVDGQLEEIVDISAPPNPVAINTANFAMDYIRHGGTVEPTQVNTNGDTAIELESIGRRVADQAAIVGPLFDTMFRNT